MKRLILVLVALLALTIEANAQARKLVRVFLEDRQQAEELISYNLDFASHGFRRFADVVVTADHERFLLRQGFTLQILTDDLQRAFAERFAGLANMGAYHTYQEMYDGMLQISQSHPQITRLNSIGQSIEGRQIWAMKVSDNPNLEEENEPDLLFMANMHAREVITPEIIIHFLNYLVQNYGSDPQVTEYVNEREFWLIPTQNPDGHVYVENVDAWWRKNRRNNGGGYWGVDLNRNYGYKWGFDDVGSSPFPGSETYRGTGPFSEPESQAIRQLCQTHHFVLALSFHSYGRLWLFPWGYVPENTPHHPVFLELANNCVAFNGYTPGNPASGTIYITNGDTDDYFYGEQTEKNLFFSFTPEVGDEFWPPESQIPILTQENLGPMLYFAEVAPIVADNPWRLMRPATPVIAPISEVEDEEYTVSWTIADDPNNPAVAFQLDELSGFTAVTDGAETGEDNWTLNGFSSSTVRKKSGLRSFYSGQGDNLNSHMTSTLPMVVEAGSQLIFWTWYNIEYHWDYAYVEVSADGGVTFHSIPGNITTNSNPNGNNLGNGITGTSGTWIQGIFNLNNFAGQTIHVRFRYVTDEYIINEGLYADDVYPVPTYEVVQTLGNNITDLSYSITGKENGTYYYRVRAKDGEAQWGAWSVLEDVVVQGGSITFDFPQAGWYLISLPVEPPDNSVTTLFPTAIAAFGWNSTIQAYYPVDSLETKKGYWLAFASATTATISGSSLDEYTAHYEPGWHLIGSLRQVVDFSNPNDTPAGAIVAAYGWEPVVMQYEPVFPVPPGSGELAPMQGYWIAATQSCDLTLGDVATTTSTRVTKASSLEAFHQRFGEAPPLPPAPVLQFDRMAQLPTTYGLSQSYPNPFNPTTVISFQLPVNSEVSLAIYSLNGQLVKRLASGEFASGVHEVVWDATNDRGLRVASGVYLYVLKAGEFVAKRKLVLMK